MDLESITFTSGEYDFDFGLNNTMVKFSTPVCLHMMIVQIMGEVVMPTETEVVVYLIRHESVLTIVGTTDLIKSGIHFPTSTCMMIDFNKFRGKPVFLNVDDSLEVNILRGLSHQVEMTVKCLVEHVSATDPDDYIVFSQLDYRFHLNEADGNWTECIMHSYRGKLNVFVFAECDVDVPNVIEFICADELRVISTLYKLGGKYCYLFNIFLENENNNSVSIRVTDRKYDFVVVAQ